MLNESLRASGRRYPEFSNGQGPNGYRERQTLQPRPDLPTVFRPADIVTNRVEFGFNGDPPDCILVVSAGGIAGGGPATQTLQVAEGSKALAASKNIPIGFVGTQSELPYFADPGFTGELPPLKGVVKGQATNTVERYQEVEEAMIQALNNLADEGRNNVFVVSNGYTGYVPRGVKNAINQVNRERGINMQAKVVIQDSSPPDTDNPSEQLDPHTGYPLDRFAHSSYASDANTTVHLVINNWLDVNIKWTRSRIPNGIIAGAASFPFTQEYVDRWKDFRGIPHDVARSELSNFVRPTNPNMARILRDPSVIFTPFFASSGYWDKNNVGKWMTPEQYQDILDGSKSLVEAASVLSQSTQRKVALSVTGVQKFIDIAKSLDIYNVHDESEYSPEAAPGVYLIKSPPFKQNLYGLYMRAADVGVFRTSQTNTMAEAVLAGVPCIVLTTPAHGYMQVERMDTIFRNEGGRQYGPNVDPRKLADRMQQIVEDQGEAASLRETQDRIFDHVHGYQGTNFFSILGHIAGISK